VSKVELIGSDLPLDFVQNEQGLNFTPKLTPQPLSGITDPQLATAYRVLRIRHDRAWMNDDDPGVVAVGWTRRSNLGTGDFNNDLSFSDTPGNVWSCTFTGSGVSVIAPREPAAGNVEIQIDGETRATADLSADGARRPQQNVWQTADLAPGRHTIRLIHRGPGPVAVDAIVPQ